jgi:hypothetical protein
MRLRRSRLTGWLPIVAAFVRELRPMILSLDTARVGSESTYPSAAPVNQCPVARLVGSIVTQIATLNALTCRR